MEAALGILLASLAGSAHCAAMCGPFVAFAAAGSASGTSRGRFIAAYNAGRLVAYASLGLAAGSLGAGVDRLGGLAGISRAAAVVAGSVMVLWGLDTILAMTGRRVARLHPPAALQRAVTRAIGSVQSLAPSGRAAVTGLATALLPCGWLYAFVAAAGGTGSPWYGALLMVVFWTGSLPVMVTVGYGLQRLAGPLRARLPIVTAATVVVIGLFTIAGRLQLPASLTSRSTVSGHVHE
jgi:sulfite exporter TauE/SafE